MIPFPNPNVAKHLAGQARFLNTPLDELLPIFTTATTKPLSLSDARPLAFGTFKRACQSVPAYKKLLDHLTVNESNITDDLEGWNRVPVVNKDNYINKYSLAERCVGGILTLAADLIHLSSGSSGNPTFWARTISDELEISIRFEQILRDNFYAHERRSLVVMVLPMGAWVGGLYSTNCLRNIALKGYPLTLITPGTNPHEALRIFRILSPQFDQTIIVGYPPFVKSLIDSGLREDIPFSTYNIKMILAGEVFTEEWRTLVCSRAGCTDPTSIVSIYGTADAGVLACESPLSIRIRSRLSKDPALARRLFKSNTSRLPTLCQFDPRNRFLELDPEKNTILLTTCGDNVMTPLVRYGIGDAGGVIEFNEMMECEGLEGVAEEVINDKRTVRKMPFVFLYGRQHWVVSIFGANVYVENIMAALDSAEIAASITGKFILTTIQDTDSDIRLHIIVELIPQIQSTSALTDKIAQTILETLQRLNSEYTNYVPQERQLPFVELRVFGDEKYFPAGVKHRYTL